jgi:hypothetical protein
MSRTSPWYDGPRRYEIDPGRIAQCEGVTDKRAQCEVVGAARFDFRDHRLAHSGSFRKLGLGQPRFLTKISDTLMEHQPIKFCFDFRLEIPFANLVVEPVHERFFTFHRGISVSILRALASTSAGILSRFLIIPAMRKMRAPERKQ